ncbi:MAG: SDR family NAD(P)-dependent oxidoreductase [Sphingomicrobium sp.]
MERAIVIGSSGGIGGAVADRLDATGVAVRRLARSAGTIDLTDRASIAAAADAAAGDAPYDLILVASGLLHGEGLAPEKSLHDLDAQRLLHSFAVNAVGPALVARHFVPLLPKHGRGVFACLSARVGSISDNRSGGWYGYRASKAALNMLIKTIAIEVQRSRPDMICVALHPGTVDTGLSKPFQRGVPAEKLFTPDFSAERLLAVLDELTPEDSGNCFAWDGARVAP